MNNLFIKSLTGISIIGAVLVSLNLPLPANLLWSISNPLMAVYNSGIEQDEQAVLFSVFTLIAWFGVFNSYARVV